MLDTARLFLVPSSLPMLEAIADDDLSALSLLLGGAEVASGWIHFPESMVWMRDYLREHDAEPGWWNYLIVHRDDACLIGTCGFKGPPDYTAAVEIGYEIAPSYQRQGYGTEAARRLCEYAFAHDAVNKITAMTLSEENPSTMLLRRLGFEFQGGQIDMEGESVWEWELKK
jgi:[ribosomal protein S5]-alanine N-acetyltransferase